MSYLGTGGEISAKFSPLDDQPRLKRATGTNHVDATAGDFLYVPQGGVHGFSNVSGAEASMLVLFAPGAPREKFFTELIEIRQSGRELSADEWAEFYARHDQYMVS